MRGRYYETIDYVGRNHFGHNYMYIYIIYRYYVTIKHWDGRAGVRAGVGRLGTHGVPRLPHRLPDVGRGQRARRGAVLAPAASTVAGAAGQCSQDRRADGKAAAGACRGVPRPPNCIAVATAEVPSRGRRWFRTDAAAKLASSPEPPL